MTKEQLPLQDRSLERLLLVALEVDEVEETLSVFRRLPFEVESVLI